MAKVKPGVQTKVRVDVKLVLGFLVGPVLVLLVWLLFTSPAQSAASAAEVSAESAASSASAASARLSRLEGGAGSLADAYLRQAYKLDTLLPSNADQIAAGNLVLGAARNAGASVTALTPAAGQDKAVGAGLGSSVFQVQVSGSPANILRFFGSVDRLDRLVTVSQASVQAGGAGADQSSGGGVAPAPQSGGTVSGSGGAAGSATLQVWSFSQPTLNETK